MAAARFESVVEALRQGGRAPEALDYLQSRGAKSVSESAAILEELLKIASRE
jgi:hypothetical protein